MDAHQNLMFELKVMCSQNHSYYESLVLVGGDRAGSIRCLN